MSILIPTLNEEENIRHVLEELLLFIDDTYEIIIIDGGSSDRTVQIARNYPVRILFASGGKGAAIDEGARHANGTYVLIFDGDFSHRSSEIRQYVDELDNGADLVKGSRFLPGGMTNDMTAIRLVGNRLFLKLSNLTSGSEFTDLCYGLFAARKELFETLDVNDGSFAFDARFVVRAVRKGYSVKEVASRERTRLNGVSHLRISFDGLKILEAILTETIFGWVGIGRKVAHKKVILPNSKQL